MLGRPKRPTAETVARILAVSDDVVPVAVEYDSEIDEARDLMAKLFKLGVPAIDYGLHHVPKGMTGIEHLRTFYARKLESGRINGLVLHCPVCNEIKHNSMFVRRKGTAWCKTCDKDPTKVSPRQAVAAELARQQRETDFDTRPGAQIKRASQRLPRSTAEEAKVQAALVAAVERLPHLLPRVRHLVRTMRAGYSSRSALTGPRVDTSDTPDPTGNRALEEHAATPVHVVEAGHDPAAYATTLYRNLMRHISGLVTTVDKLTQLVPDQPPAIEWMTCLECGERIGHGELKNLMVDGSPRPYHKGKCWQAAYRRRRRPEAL